MGVDEIVKTIEFTSHLPRKYSRWPTHPARNKNRICRKAIDYLGRPMITYRSRGALTTIRPSATFLKHDIEVLWKHAGLTNEILTFLYKRITGNPIPDMCSMAGLLHDIGKVVLIYNFSDRHLKAAWSIRNKEDMSSIS